LDKHYFYQVEKLALLAIFVLLADVSPTYSSLFGHNAPILNGETIEYLKIAFSSSFSRMHMRRKNSPENAAMI